MSDSKYAQLKVERQHATEFRAAARKGGMTILGAFGKLTRDFVEKVELESKPRRRKQPAAVNPAA